MVWSRQGNSAAPATIPQDMVMMKSTTVDLSCGDAPGAKEASAAPRLVRSRTSALRLISAMIGLHPTVATNSHIMRRFSCDGSSMAIRSIQARIPSRSPTATAVRSEEHTSELQSLMRISYAVFCLQKQTSTSRPRQYQTHTHKTHTHNC